MFVVVFVLTVCVCVSIVCVAAMLFVPLLLAMLTHWRLD